MFIEKTESAVTRTFETTSLTTIQLVGDPGTFSVVVERSDGEGGWDSCYSDGTEVVLDATNTSISVFGHFRLRLNKEASSGYSFGVELG